MRNPCSATRVASRIGRAGRAGKWPNANSFPLASLASFLFLAAHAAALNPAVTPTDRLNESWWATRHHEIVEDLGRHADYRLLLIGDSITHNYVKSKLPDENFQPTWNLFYAPRNALNLGFSGDTTANVLWRIDHGELSGLHPKVTMLLIGTNNTGHANQTAEETESGIDAVIANLERRLPQTHILLLGILPSALLESKTVRDLEVNRYLENAYGENPRVTYLDVGSIFFKHGTLNASIFYDPRLPQHGKPLHPDTNGQRMMAEAIEPTLARLMDDKPAMPLVSMTGINSALIPVEPLEQDSYDWYARHNTEVAVQRSLRPSIVLIGDSITHFWGGPPASAHVNGPSAWQRAFGDVPVLNMGFGWDRTQNVLWRLQHGEFEGIAPQWIVLAIGTNNLTGTKNARANTPQEIADSIGAICQLLHSRSPQSRILLMGIFPRGPHSDSALRAPIEATNRLLSALPSSEQAVTFLDIGQQFLTPDGSLPETLMFDGTHPTDAGYQIWADALRKAGVVP